MMTKKEKILIVEDNVLIALDIKSVICDLDFEISDVTSSYKDTIKSVDLCKPNLIIMDIFIKGARDGIETSIAIKKKYDIPIIFLTSHTEESVVQRAFEINPESYISKPFKREDLRSAVLLALHKNKNINSSVNKKHIGENFFLDLKSKDLYCNDELIKLGKKEKKLLEILLNANGAIVKLEELEDEIWTKTPASSSSLRTLIYRLRSKLNDTLIETVPYYGCRIKK